MRGTKALGWLGMVAATWLVAIAAWAQVAGESAPEAPYVDESSVWFTAINHQEASGGPPVNVGWGLDARMRLLGEIPRHSAFHFVLRQGRRQVGELRCDGDSLSGALEAARCHDDAQRLRVTGTILVDASWIDGDTDVETPIRTYTLEIATVSRTRGGGVADASQQYVNRNGGILDNVIQQAPLNAYGTNNVHLFVRASTPEDGYSDADSVDSQFRCTVDGERIALPDRHNQVHVSWPSQPFLQVVHSRDQPRDVNPIRDFVSYRTAVIQLPFTWGPPDRRVDGDVVLEDHPGAWECQWRVSGRPIRTFRWTVRDGAIQPHAEELAGLRFGPNVHFVETVIHGESIIDQRVDPAAVRAGGFYGRAWVTEAARAMAAAVPRVGEPTPPQPRSPGFAGAASDAAPQRGRRRGR